MMLFRLILIISILPALAAPLSAQEEQEQGLFETEFGKDPTYIQSSTLTLQQNKRVFLYEKGVEMRQGDMKLTSEALEGTYDENNKIQFMVASKNVIITKGDGVRATGERARYESKDETMTLTGSPELIQGDSVLTADKVVIHLEEDRSEALGNVKVRIKEDAKDPQAEEEADPEASPINPILAQ